MPSSPPPSDAGRSAAVGLRTDGAHPGAALLSSDPALLERIIASADVGIVSFDRDKRFTSWNPAMERLYGVTAAEVVGRTLVEAFPFLVAQGLDDAYDQALAGATSSVRGREITTRATGETAIVDATYRPLRDASGAVVGGVGVLRDITDERRRMLRLRELSTVVEQTGESVVLTDARGCITWVNSAWERMTGWTLDEVRGRKPGDFLQGAGTDARARSLMGRAIHAGRPFTGDILNYRRDGTPFWSNATITPIREEDGALHGWVGVKRDVTKRRAAEEAISRERERLADAIEALDAGFLMYDAEERLVAYNERFVQTGPPGVAPPPLGTRLEDVLRAALVDGRHPVTGEDGEPWIDRMIARHRWPGTGFEENLGRVTMRVDISPTREGGRVVLLTDITALKSSQAELEIARDAANAASRAKSDFLARMSHELRTPLNAIIGFTKVVLKNRDGTLAPRDADFLGRVEANGMRLLGLVNDILDLAKVEAGRVEVVRTSTDVAQLVRETVAQCEGYPRRPGVALRSAVPILLLPIESDGAKLRQVLVNLVSNALKFTAHGEVVVRVRADAAGRPTSVEVADTGSGIPADRLDAIFAPFEQAAPSVARDHGGTGLGLSISRSLCEMLGATLQVTSQVGVGTTFTVTF